MDSLTALAGRGTASWISIRRPEGRRSFIQMAPPGGERRAATGPVAKRLWGDAAPLATMTVLGALPPTMP